MTTPSGHRPIPESSSSTISGSGSVQSHLSTANSQQRLRATNAYATLNKEFSKDSSSFDSSPISPTLSNPATLAHALRVLFPSPEASVQFPDHSSRSWKGLAFKWMGLVYCFLSIIFTSTSLYTHLYLGNPVGASISKELGPAFLTVEQRVSRLSPYLGGSFEPHVLLPRSPADGITACLWSKDDGQDNFDSLISWAFQWTGPISLVMVTSTRLSSVSHQQLLQRLQTLRDHPSLSGLSLHLFHQQSPAESPSAYLNLARLFSNSPTVMLFPANLSNVLPSNFYNTLSSHIPHPPTKPLLITNAAPSVLSVPDLTPVILPRNYPIWCSERAFLASRTSDWNDCMWQLWLEEYGLGHANITVALHPEESTNSGVDSGGLTRLRNSLSGKFRAEICEVALRRFSTGDTARAAKSAKRRLQWLKSFCRQVRRFD
ncbi:hypothetical protein C8R45DRAFT_107750 [Mycena sanguinolenta]|nr:hypothetical protein C8R45DRAFT_107750 [Mycena sanguinolenta]